MVEGVAYRLTGFHHGARLPISPDMRDIRDSDVVGALAGAELVQVVLTVELVDAARPPDSVFCDITLEDPAGRSWHSHGTVGYEVSGPATSSCTGVYQKTSKVGVPFEVGTVSSGARRRRRRRHRTGAPVRGTGSLAAGTAPAASPPPSAWPHDQARA